MKRKAFIINTARGKIINENDLLYALKNKIIAGAGLDVIDGEWLSNEKRVNHKLVKYSRNHNNLLITPHIGGATQESIQKRKNIYGKKSSQIPIYF